MIKALEILFRPASAFDETPLSRDNRRVASPKSGPVAQLGARFHGMEEVIGSIPIRSTNKPNNLADSQKKRDTLSIRWFSCCVLRSTFADIPRPVQQNIDNAALRLALG